LFKKQGKKRQKFIYTFNKIIAVPGLNFTKLGLAQQRSVNEAYKEIY
jgi:hypothetical protein